MEELKALFEAVARGERSATAALQEAEKIITTGFEDLGFACVDHDRERRCGFPEVVLAAGKTPEQVLDITRAIMDRSGVVLVTRISEETAAALVGEWPEAVHNFVARTVVVGAPPEPRPEAGQVLVVAAGTSDAPVAEEAAVTAAVMGCPVESLCDVGVAGLHRLLAHRQQLQTATAIVVVAGMEGALPSVIGGLVAAPVIGVPTSTGYGASFGGVAALLGMLNACAAGVSVVNIDNGFGAGYVAARIALAHVARGDD